MDRALGKTEGPIEPLSGSYRVSSGPGGDNEDCIVGVVLTNMIRMGIPDNALIRNQEG